MEIINQKYFKNKNNLLLDVIYKLNISSHLLEHWLMVGLSNQDDMLQSMFHNKVDYLAYDKFDNDHRI